MNDLSLLEKIPCDREGLQKIHTETKQTLLTNPRNRRYLEVLDDLPPPISTFVDFHGDTVEVGRSQSVDGDKLHEVLVDLKPWKKGPFKVCGTFIDSEWQSHLKWNRLSSVLPSLEGKHILDIGSNNGYFMFRSLAHRPSLVLGLDPIMRVYVQFLLLQKFAACPNMTMGLWGVDHLGLFARESFDVVFSMGIIYHHRNPIGQLVQTREIIKKGGLLVLESLGVPGPRQWCLFPKKTYAKMRNIWFVPTLSCLMNWAYRAKFKEVTVVFSLPLSTEEQRATEWSGPVSLSDFLHPEDKTKTIEGYPAPMRFCLLCRKGSP